MLMHTRYILRVAAKNPIMEFKAQSFYNELPDSGKNFDFNDECVDPRIQVELEKLNKASEEINRLEFELDDARATYRQTLSDSTKELDILTQSLGASINKARPYYDARLRAKEAQLETQRAALRFERACNMHEVAKEMVQMAEQGFECKDQSRDPSWQEMLNQATMKVNEAEKEREQSENEHELTMVLFNSIEENVHVLRRKLKRAINKSRIYFDMKARFNKRLEECKTNVSGLEEAVFSSKSRYSSALRCLEAISEEIHRHRLEKRRQRQLGVRGSGVGSECPVPAYCWEKSRISMKDETCFNKDHQLLDPLGVLKISVPASDSTGWNGDREADGKNEQETASVDGVGRSHEFSHVPAGEPSKTTRDGETTGQESGATFDPEFHLEGLIVSGDPLGVVSSAHTTRLNSPRVSPSGARHPSHVVTTTRCPSEDRLQVPSGHAAGTHCPVYATSMIVCAIGTLTLSDLSLDGRVQETGKQHKRTVVNHSESERCDEVERSTADSASIPPSLNVAAFSPTLPRSPKCSYSSPVHLTSFTVMHSRPLNAVGGREDAGIKRKLMPCDEYIGGSGRPDRSTSYHGQLARVKPSRPKLQGLILKVDPAFDNFGSDRFEAIPTLAKTLELWCSSAYSRRNNSPVSRSYDTTIAADSLLHKTICIHDSVSIHDSVYKGISTTGDQQSGGQLTEVKSPFAVCLSAKSCKTNQPSASTGVSGYISDTESLSSAGPMMDDNQLAFLCMDFSELTVLSCESSPTIQYKLKDQKQWTSIILPPSQPTSPQLDNLHSAEDCCDAVTVHSTTRNQENSPFSDLE